MRNRGIALVVLACGALAGCQGTEESLSARSEIAAASVGAAPPTQPPASAARSSAAIAAPAASAVPAAGNGRRVTVPAFRVTFQQTTKATASASPLLGRGSARASQHATLSGIPEPVYQRIVDGAYRDFLAKARAAGLSVAGPEAAQSVEKVRAASTIPNNTVPPPNAVAEGFFGRDGNVLRHVSPGGVPNYGRSLDGVGQAFGSIDSAIGDIAKTTGSTVGYVLYHVDFASNWSSNQNPLGRLGRSASVEITPQVSLRDGLSGALILTPAAAACVGYCPNIGGKRVSAAARSEEAFVSQSRSAMGAGEQAGHALAAGIGALSGMGMSVGANEIVADPARYEAIVSQLLAEANTKVVAALAAAE
jgi:hypothetical protein